MRIRQMLLLLENFLFNQFSFFPYIVLELRPKHHKVNRASQALAPQQRLLHYQSNPCPGIELSHT
jgi:hypothetical protein